MRRAAFVCVLTTLMMTGCATSYLQGQAALQQGHYDEAAGHFQEALARDPARLDALVGLGVSRYKLGAFDEAVGVLSRVLARVPQQREARLYLGLSYLRKGEDGLADEQLTALADLKPHPRLAALIDRALKLLRAESPLSEEVRSFLAASLEDEVQWEREVREAQRLRPAYVEPFFFGFHRCFRDRLGRLICF